MADNSFSFITLEQRAKRVAERHGVQLPIWSQGEWPNQYIGRCANLFREFAPELAKMDMTRAGNPDATMRFAAQVFEAAERARPHGPPGGGLRYIATRDAGGREIIRPAADTDDACWRQFTHNTLKVGKFLRPPTTKATLV